MAFGPENYDITYTDSSVKLQGVLQIRRKSS